MLRLLALLPVVFLFATAMGMEDEKAAAAVPPQPTASDMAEQGPTPLKIRGQGGAAASLSLPVRMATTPEERIV